MVTGATLPDYGPVWTPVGVAPGWAPYRFGHWVWVAPWGWTWVENEPWGFAPFHYGRWAFRRRRGWVLGSRTRAVRPVFAPALVAFVGGGALWRWYRHWRPAVGWFPLAPREVFVPWYRTSRVYVNNVNITNTRVNVTQVNNVYNTTIINNRRRRHSHRLCQSARGQRGHRGFARNLRQRSPRGPRYGQSRRQAAGRRSRRS